MHKFLHKIYILIVLFVAGYGSLYSHFLTQHYTQEQGLPSSNVYCVTQDKNGAIWAATFSGLGYYDGYRWKHLPDETDRMRKAIISRIFFDEQDILWGISLNSGVQFVNVKNRKHSLPKIPFQNHIFNTVYHCGFNNQNGKITAAFTNESKSLWMYVNNQWKKVDLVNRVNFNSISGVEATHNRILMVTDQGIISIYENSISFELNKILGTEGKPIYGIAKDRKDKEKIWIFTPDYIGYLKNDKLTKVSRNPLSHLPEKELIGSNIVVDNIGIAYIFNSRHIYAYSTKSDELILLNKKTGLTEDYCRDIFIGNENIAWISTSLGISKVPSLRFNSHYEQTGLLEDEVTSIVKISDNKFLAGHNTGFTLVENQTKFTRYPFSEKRNNTRVFNMVRTKEGTILAAAKTNGLIFISPNMAMKQVNPQQLGIREIVSVAIDSSEEKNILFASYTCVFKYNNGKPIKLFSKKDISIRSISVTKNGKIVITTMSHGVFYQKDNKFINATAECFDGNSTNCFFEDPRGIAWVGTDCGLLTLSRNKLVRPILLPDELTKYRVLNILRYSDEELWMATDQGVLVLDRQYNVRLFTNRDGLSGLEVHRHAFIKLNENKGNMVIGTNKGLSIYNPAFDFKEKVKPILRYLNLKVNTQSFPLNRNYTFNFDDNNLRFEFNAISYYNEKYNRIYYKLHPIQDTFSLIEVNDADHIDFYKLPPNEYQLIVRAQNAQGTWSDDLVSPYIVIDYQYYYQTWFIILTMVTIANVFYFAYRFYYFKQENTKLEIEAHKYEVEAQLKSALLESSEGRYRKMFYDNNAKMLIVDPENFFVNEMNPSMIEYCEEFDVVVPYEVSLLDIAVPVGYNEKELSYMLNNEKEVELLVNFKKNDETDLTRHLHLFLTQLYNNDQLMTYIILNDVTEAKLTEKKINELNENLEKIVQERTNELSEALEAVYAEITHRMETEAEIVRAKEDLRLALEREKDLNKLKSQFILMVSHEYRTPLTVIYSSAELIKEFVKMGAVEQTVEYSKRIQLSVESLTKLVEEAVKLSDDSAIISNNEKFDYNAFLSSIVLDISEASKNSHNIIIDGFLKNSEIIQDRNLLKQSIGYIIDNAIKYSNKGSNIIIKNSIKDKKLNIVITDFGIGIDDYSLGKVFEPFFKAKSTIGIYSGTGLGLSITKKYVLSMGGTIRIESEEGKGTSVTIQLPIDHF